MGNEGDDWIEGGEGFDSLSGENSELFFNSPIIGHDILDGQGNDTDYDGENGDDIMVQGPGIQRSNGMDGFDWAIHKGDPNAADSDLGITIFDTRPALILRDRFDSVEGLSGWKFDDILTGAAKLVLGENFDKTLKQSGVDRIAGLDAVIGNVGAPNPTNDPNAIILDQVRGDAGGEILLGGDGSDIITGNLGDDIIDGDAWLNVRISIHQNKDGTGPEIATVDSLKGVIQAGAGVPASWVGQSLDSLMVAGTINPGQLKAVREILYDQTPADSRDVAVFNDEIANYILDINPDNSLTVTHVPIVGGGGGGGGGGGLGGLIDDGTDTLRNIEVLRFSDGVGGFIEYEVNFLFNAIATGTPSISDLTPTSGQALVASTLGISDQNGLPLTFDFQWQSSANNGLTWSDIGGAFSDTFTPTSGQVGTILRVVVSFLDGAGFGEQVVSSSTGLVGRLFNGGVNADTFNGTAGSDQAFGNGNNDTLNGFGGDDTLDGGAGNDALNGGIGADQMSGGIGDDTYNVDNAGDVVIEAVGAGSDRVISSISYTLADNVERLDLIGSAITGTGNGLDNVLAGNLAANKLFGGDGNDTLNGGGGADEMTGGTGNDIYYVDNSADVVIEALNAGDDRVYSGADFTLGNNVERLYMTGTAINGTGNGLANLINGTAGHNVIKGGGGADIILGGGGDDDLFGEAGNDSFIFGLASGHDTIFAFDADPAGGQDKIDLQTRGISTASFAGSVSISASGLDTLIQFIGGDSITIKDVAPANIDITDFKLLI